MGKHTSPHRLEPKSEVKDHIDICKNCQSAKLNCDSFGYMKHETFENMRIKMRMKLVSGDKNPSSSKCCN